MKYWEKDLLELDRLNVQVHTNIIEIIDNICIKYKVSYLIVDKVCTDKTILFSNPLDELHLKKLYDANNEAIRMLNKHPYYILKQLKTNNQLKIHGKLHI